MISSFSSIGCHGCRWFSRRRSDYKFGKPWRTNFQPDWFLSLSIVQLSSSSTGNMVSAAAIITSILAVAILSSTPPAHSATLDSDVQALYTLKDTLDPNSISPTSFLSTWDFKVDPCESGGAHFLGVLCTIPEENVSSRVTEIDLDGAGYDGFLTPQIGDLTELTALSLNGNSFRGPLPTSIFNLTKLNKLSFSGNSFTGKFSSLIGNLKKIETIDVSNNRLSGSIPTTICGLRYLRNIDLSRNNFAGRIPDFNGLWKLHNLDLSSNMLYGNIPRLPVNLRTLILSHNTLSGHISTISQLEHLKILDLSDNRFTGFIPSGVLTLPEVTNVNVSLNRFTALQAINFAGRETQLQIFDAQRNLLRGSLPINLVTITNLTELCLSHNQFTGEIPAEYGMRLEISWQALYLNHNYLVGDLPTQFSNILATTKTGSLARNCLYCPSTIALCRGGQRSAAECIGQND